MAKAVVPLKYVALTKNKASKYFIKEVTREENKYPNFELDVITTVTYNAAKYKVTDII